MQKEPKPGTPKLNSGKRLRNPGTPDNRIRNIPADIAVPTINRTINFRHRTTMTPGEMMIPPGLITKRRIGSAARLNATLCQPPTGQVPMKAEVELSENELGLLYDKYVQARAGEILLKKKIEEKYRLINIQIAAASKEKKIVKNKFQKSKLREDEIRYSNLVQFSIDAQTTQIDNCFDELRRNEVKEKLLQLKTVLEPLDVLRCQGIVIPENPEDTKELFESLEEIGDVLKRIQECSRGKGKVYKDVEKGLNDLVDKHGEIECVKNKFDEVLCELQVHVLKNASTSLAQNYVDELN